MLIRTIVNVVFFLPEEQEKHERFREAVDTSKWNAYVTPTVATYSTSTKVVTGTDRHEDD